MRFILASKSPSRLELLRRAGLNPEVRASDVDESQFDDPQPVRLALRLAEAKGRAVAEQVAGDAIFVACDSVLEFEGRSRGKPQTQEAAIAQWQRMRGRQGVLHTGHFVLVRSAGQVRHSLRTASTVVKFADITDEEIAAYAATGEPLWVAGAFTIDGLGGAFVTALEGDPHNVVGISLPLLRQILVDLGIDWPSLWDRG
ncbi:MAG: Maf family protein [Propionibacteriaceae bacterium]|nr:Maf family protein [Propionibacteriaceae bacterium]